VRSAYHEVGTARELTRALTANAIPIVQHRARMSSSAPSTLMMAGGALVASGRAFVRVYGGSVRASGTVTVVAEHSARVRVQGDAVVFLDRTFAGTVRVDDGARCIPPGAAIDAADFCRIHRIEVERGAIAVSGLERGRGYAGDAAWYRAFTRRRRPPVTLVPLRDLKTPTGHGLMTKTGVAIEVHMTTARAFRAPAGSELRIDGTSRRTVSARSRVSVGDQARVVVRGRSLVTAWGNAHVEVTDDAMVVALDGARVVARGRAFVRAFDASKVEAHDEAVVLASEFSRVVARDASCVETEFWAVVEARDQARVRAFETSTVYAGDAVRVEAAGWAVVHAEPQTRVLAGPCVTLRRHPAL